MRRPGILQEYRAIMVSYICRVLDIKEDVADKYVLEIMRERYKPLTGLVADNHGIPGNQEIYAVDLVSYLDKHAGDLISPSGSIFCQHAKKIGASIGMIFAKLKQRKYYKGLMLAAKAIGDAVKTALNNSLQTSTKITINALPGNTGSKYSLFCDKGNYNAITSTGRSLIGYANTCIEHVLGGNFGWYSIDQLLNHIAIHIRPGIIDQEAVRRAMHKYGLAPANHEQLMQFFIKFLNMYNLYKEEDYEPVREVVSKLTNEEVQFFWYYQNLRHLFMDNDAVFRNWMNDMFDISKVKMNDVDPQAMYKLEDALVTFVNVAFSKHVSSGDPSIQAMDLPKKMPDKAKLFVNIANHVQEHLNWIKDMLDVFVDTKLCVPDVQNRKLMLRNSSVVSDTDSVIFTVKDWVQWYTGDIYKLGDDAFQVASLIIYLITKAVAHSLKLFSIAHGAEGERVTDMQMKNEFLYTTMCLCRDVKKHYAGVVTIQEGVVLPKPYEDIKGIQFKGSDKCRDATKFAEDFIINEILKKSLDRKLVGHDLIRDVMKFERRIYDDFQQGKTTWLEPIAIKNAEDYNNAPESTPYFYYMVWEEVFAAKYGHIQLPTKTFGVPIGKPNASYWAWLDQVNPKASKKFQAFITTHGKVPSKIALSPNSDTIPKEIVPLVTIRDIIWECTGPERLILKQLGINCGFEKNKLLFSEVYSDDFELSTSTQTKGNEDE